MERFELRDIVAQDKHGIVYAAHDTLLDHKVSIRRFFPFGQDGGGLEKEEAIAFEIAAKRLSDLKHASLRSVIFGAVDSIDSMPYLVTEWVEGASLQTILADEKMEPALVIDVLRIAMEVSIILSHVLGEEAVWVETEIESIVVGTEDGGRGFTFWISPFKWLGSEVEARKLSSIVTLGEELTGWGGRLVSDQAGHGLGSWLKWLRKNPDATLREALESLAASTGKEPPAAEQKLVHAALQPVSVPTRQASSMKPLLTILAVMLLAAGAVLLYLHKTAKVPEISPDYVEQEISEILIDEPLEENLTPREAQPSPPESEDDAKARVEALALKLKEDAEQASEKKALEAAAREKQLLAQRKEFNSGDGYLLPEQSELIRTLASGSEAKLKGIVRGVRISSTGKTIYLNFSEPHNNKLTNALIKIENFEGNYSLDDFKKIIGKQVMIEGSIFVESAQKNHYVKFSSMDQITVSK